MFMKECALLTQRYLLEVKKQNISIEEILTRPHWRQVYYWWLALEHYEGKEVPMSMELCRKIYGE